MNLLKHPIEWFIERIGKRVFRLENFCSCEVCKDVHKNGLIILDKHHADYLLYCQNELKIHYLDELPSQNHTVSDVDADFPIEHKLASVWVFDTNASKWSNNDDTAGDNHASFIAGYLKAKETLYTEEQVREAIDIARKGTVTDAYGDLEVLYSFEKEEIIQSLKQPKKD
jgi:hypothetical protein